IKTGSAELHDTKISFELLPDGRVRVVAAGANGFGGKFSVQPFSFAPASGAIDFTVQATNLELGQIRIVLDAQQQRIREAVGRVSGKVALHFDKEGLRIGQGALTMRKGELARILFQPTPGLFTSYVPATIRPYYRGFEPIELGKLSLVMSAFQIKFYPDGEQADRSMLIQLQGNSSDARFPAPIDEDINVNGPLQQAIHSFLSLGRKH
ncbi:MAG: YdbH domain-containing protein, partial [Verrucomicrobiota bacterium]|nr:YdbH domain-containing protein [Verrucomicrobiota bacterium]